MEISNESKPLSELLDEYELAVQRSREDCDFADTYGMPLVKALRRAVDAIDHECSLSFAKQAKEAITRLLTLPVEQQQQKISK